MFYSTLYIPPQAEQALHIPDGFLSVLVSTVCWMLSILAVGYALRRTSQDYGERELPLMGVLAAAVFAGQMLNFPVAGGTSGHLVGAALVTILLGPWASILVMTCVVTVQALVFQDGGLLALGANIFNMAVVGSLYAAPVYDLVKRVPNGRKWVVLAGGAAAAWISVFAAACFTALQLGLSGTAPHRAVLWTMVNIHAVIGLGEALLTMGALSFILAARRELVNDSRKGLDGKALLVAVSLVLALALLAPFASGGPDGLEWVAEQLGFIDLAQAAGFEIIPDYALPGIADNRLATILAGVIGAVLVAGVFLLTAFFRRPRKSA